MDISFFRILTVLMLVGFVYILVKLAKSIRDYNDITINAIKSRKTPVLFSTVVIIIVVILLFISSSGCGGPEINNYNNASQTASEASSGTPSTSDSTSTATPTQTSSPGLKPIITIDYPLDKSTVPQELTINGTAKNIPDGQKLWIVVYPPSAKKYYPQGEVIILNDKWELPIRLGDSGNVKTDFYIMTIMADQSARKEFSNYLQNGGPEMWQLPEGAEENVKIKVTRN